MPNPALYEVRGERELRASLKRAGEDLSDLKDVHQAVGNVVIDASSPPVRTGALAGSLRASRLASGVAVKAGSAGVPYANPIHWGWPKRNIDASLFLTRGAQSSEPEWTALYEEKLNEIIDRIEGDRG